MNEDKPSVMPPVPPFVRFVASAVPMVFDDSLSYYEALCALWKYVQGMTDVINNNATLEEEYIEKFNELKTFVDTYFDNLDVQEEVNKKLDEMVEDGTLEVLIQHILSIETITLFDSLQDLIVAETINSAVVETLGFYTKGDGGGARYYITDSGTADGIFVHALDSGKYAVLANQKEFNILQIGAKRNDDTDNKDIFKFIFNSGLHDCTIYIPDGVYLTSATLHSAGQAQKTKNLHLIGLGNPVIKNKLPDTMTKTTLGTYTGNYTVTNNIGVLSFGTSCTVNIISLQDNNKFYYLAVSDKTLIPSDLAAEMVLEGENSHTEAIISSIDKDDPDGAGTARIYLFETSNDYSCDTSFEETSGTITEDFLIKLHKHHDYLYIHLVDNSIPSYVAVNKQLKQTNGKSARVNSISVAFNSYNYIELNCLPQPDVFDTPVIYLDSNVDFSINEYSGYTSEIIFLNGHENTKLENITFDGSNLEINTFDTSMNQYNIGITGGCKDITIENCTFRNAIMAGFQVGGMISAWSMAYHDYPENVTLNKCTFYNNGRHDFEIIHGKNITVNDCKIDGSFDIEPNHSQYLDNINIVNSDIDYLICYSNNEIASSSHIHVSGCKIRELASTARVIVDVVNSFIHMIAPQISTTRVSNSTIDELGGLVGNEFISFDNCSLYSLYRSLVSGQSGSGVFIANNCIIDLSIAPKTTYDQAYKEVAFKNCNVYSSTLRKEISDFRTVYNCHDTKFTNIKLVGGAGTLSSVTGSKFVNCEFLRLDNSTTAQACISGTFVPATYTDCYFEDQIDTWVGYATLINCVVNATTKPVFSSRGGITVNGLKTNDGSGINWAWVATGVNSNKVYFIDVEFNTSVTSPLGVKYGYQAVTITSVDLRSRGYYVGDSDLALCRLYDNSGSVGVKQLSFS